MTEARFQHMLRSDLVAVVVVVLSALWWLTPVLTSDGGLIRRDANMMLLAVDQLQGGLLGEGLSRMAWPLDTGGAVTDWVAGQAVLSLPLTLLGAEPATIQVFLSASGFILSALAGLLVTRLLLGPGPHTWVGGMAVGYHIAHITHQPHINLIHHETAILGAALLGLGLVRSRPMLAGVGMLIGGLSAHFGAYMGLHAGLMLAALLVSAGWHRVGDRKTWGGIAGGGLLAGLTLLPVGRLFARSARWVSQTSTDEVISRTSWDPTAFFEPSTQIAIHRLSLHANDPRMLPRATQSDPANAGFAMLMLSVLGLVVFWDRPRHRFVWWAIIGATLASMVLALGGEVIWHGEGTGIPGPHALLTQLPGLGGLRDPARWLAVSFTGMGLLSALGAWALYRRSWILGLAAVGFLMAERPATQASGRTREIAHADYDALRDVPVTGALWDTMMSPEGVRSTCGETIISAYLSAIGHDRALLGGQYARLVGVLDEVNRIALTWPDPQAALLLDALEVGLVYEHQRLTTIPEALATCQPLERHRLCTLHAAADPLPAPGVVTTEPVRAAVGVRWMAPDDLPAILNVRCGDDDQAVDGQLWWLITRLRHGPEVGFVEYFLPTTCESEVTSDPPSTLLYAETDETWLPESGLTDQR
jgi:hypothetical protein